jgi:hypothetical protein
MPPQQPHRLLDFLDQILNFRAHIEFPLLPERRFDSCDVDLTIEPGQRNRRGPEHQ